MDNNYYRPVDPYDNYYVGFEQMDHSSDETSTSRSLSRDSKSWAERNGKHVMLVESSERWFDKIRCSQLEKEEFAEDTIMPQVDSHKKTQKNDNIVDFNLIACVLLLLIVILIVAKLYMDKP